MAFIQCNDWAVFGMVKDLPFNRIWMWIGKEAASM